jgi:hypothetical protein
MKNLLTTLLVAGMLTVFGACSTAPVVIPPKQEQKIDTPAPLVTSQCPDLQSYGTDPTMGQLLTYTANLQQIYTTCATQDDSLLKVINAPQK